MKKKRLFALITSAFFILSACGTAAANQEDNSWSNVEKKERISSSDFWHTVSRILL